VNSKSASWAREGNVKLKTQNAKLKAKIKNFMTLPI
jgi:hypothetical protein